MFDRPILVTGATGFVGESLVAELVSRDASVTVVTRDPTRIDLLPWRDRVSIWVGDLYDTDRALPDVDGHEVVHLVWNDLTDFRSPLHLERHFMANLHLAKRLISDGAVALSIAGTCQEYGLQEGLLRAKGLTDPQTPYAIGKDMLRRTVASVCAAHGISFRWFRFFYIYGRRQKPNSLYPLLISALERGDVRFPMSEGRQLRDFISIEDAARQCSDIIECGATGCFNIASGRPQSVREFVDEVCQREGKSIQPEYGVYGMPDYEPFAFWGQPWEIDQNG